MTHLEALTHLLSHLHNKPVLDNLSIPPSLVQEKKVGLDSQPENNPVVGSNNSHCQLPGVVYHLGTCLLIMTLQNFFSYPATQDRVEFIKTICTIAMLPGTFITHDLCPIYL